MGVHILEEFKLRLLLLRVLLCKLPMLQAQWKIKPSKNNNRLQMRQST
jgi:hypothetical protein